MYFTNKSAFFFSKLNKDTIKIMVEQTNNAPVDDATTDATSASQATAAAEAKPAEGEAFVYPGDSGLVANSFERNPEIEPKPVPLFAYGNRVRIAALHKNYEPYLDHLI